MVASQSKTLAQNEVFELPPYADSILLEGSSLAASSSADGITFYAIDVTAIETGLYKINDPAILHKIKITSSGGGTVHYRISKR
tara:strand:+ start:3676 stop:3927 length:252 start_codon:yes stop_codon:yes gene_type:complete